MSASANALAAAEYSRFVTGPDQLGDGLKPTCNHATRQPVGSLSPRKLSTNALTTANPISLGREPGFLEHFRFQPRAAQAGDSFGGRQLNRLGDEAGPAVVELAGTGVDLRRRPFIAKEGVEDSFRRPSCRLCTSSRTSRPDHQRELRRRSHACRSHPHSARICGGLRRRPRNSCRCFDEKPRPQGRGFPVSATSSRSVTTGAQRGKLRGAVCLVPAPILDAVHVVAHLGTGPPARIAAALAPALRAHLRRLPPHTQQMPLF
jgi:hypothetical protein